MIVSSVRWDIKKIIFKYTATGMLSVEGRVQVGLLVLTETYVEALGCAFLYKIYR